MIRPLVISGPSGVGKTFLVNKLIEKYPFKLVLSTMTRAPRSGERNLVDNEFLSDEEFENSKNDFFFTIEVLNAKYAYRESFVDKIQSEGFIPISIMYTPNADLWFKKYPESFGIFLYPKDTELLKKRMENRGENPETIERRMNAMKEEIRAFEEDFRDLYKAKVDIEDDKSVYEAIKIILKEYKLD